MSGGELPFSIVTNSAGVLLVVIDGVGRISYCTHRCAELTGYAPEEVVGRPVWEVLVPKDEREHAKNSFAMLAKGEYPVQYRSSWLAKDGKRLNVHWSVGTVRNRSGQDGSVVSVGKDATFCSAGAETSGRDGEFYHALVDHALEVITVIDAEGTIRFESPSIERVLGYRPEELIGRNGLELIHPDDVGAVQQILRQATRTPGKIDVALFRFRHADGSWRHLEVAGKNLLTDPAINGVIISSRDVTERHLGALELHRINRLLRIVRTCNALLVRATDEDVLMTEVCQLIVADGTYALAWVGYAEEDDEKLVTPVCIQGPASEYAQEIVVTWNDGPTGQGPVGRAIRTGEPVVIDSLSRDPSFATWRTRARKHGLKSAAGFPLKATDRTFGSLAVYSTKTNAFSAEEIALLNELAADLGYGISSIKERRKRRAAQSREIELAMERDKALLGTIEAIASAAEARDPYTAGHERRVAKLSRAIALEMGIPAERCDGIKIAATIHDIGKLNVPMEILARPTKLTDAEQALMRQHVETGYRILKGVEFPWPVATVVLQHHERMDGSGYPSGLEGDEILVEARIVAVADVIEAMATHRPYRPAHGIDAALLYVLENKGTMFDPNAVDACLRVFKKGAFRFEISELNSA